MQYKHTLKNYLQKAFDKNNSNCKNPPFSNDLSASQIDTILDRFGETIPCLQKLIGQTCSYCERPSRYIKRSKNGYECSYCGTVSPIFDSVRNQLKIK